MASHFLLSSSSSAWLHAFCCSSTAFHSKRGDRQSSSACFDVLARHRLYFCALGSDRPGNAPLGGSPISDLPFPRRHLFCGSRGRTPCAASKAAHDTLDRRAPFDKHVCRPVSHWGLE